MSPISKSVPVHQEDTDSAAESAAADSATVDSPCSRLPAAAADLSSPTQSLPLPDSVAADSGYRKMMSPKKRQTYRKRTQKQILSNKNTGTNAADNDGSTDPIQINQAFFL